MLQSSSTEKPSREVTDPTPLINPTPLGKSRSHGIKTISTPAKIDEVVGNGKIFVTAHKDGVIRVWDISTRQLLKELHEHEEEIYGLALEGDLLVSGARKGRMILWDTTTWEVLQVLDDHNETIFRVRLKNDVLVTASFDNSSKVYDIVDRRAVLRFTLAPNPGPVEDVDFTEKMAATACRNDVLKVRYWDSMCLLCVHFPFSDLEDERR